MNIGKHQYRKENARKKLEYSKESSVRKQLRIAYILLTIFAVSALLYVIAFAYLPKTQSGAMVGRAIPTQIFSIIDFSYESEILTKMARSQAVESISPSYKIDSSINQHSQDDIDKLEDYLASIQKAFDALSVEQKTSADVLENHSNEIKKVSTLSISPQDLQVLLAINPDSRTEIFNQVQFRLKSVFADGIYEDNNPVFTEASILQNAYKIEGATRTVRIRSLSEAIEEFKRRILTMGNVDNDTAYVLFRISNQELRANIGFDKDNTQKRKAEIMDKVKPVIVKVRAGEPILSPDIPNTELVQEKRNAYHKELSKSYTVSDTGISNVINNFSCSLFLVCGATLFIIISKTRTNKRRKTIGIFLILLTSNLILERILIQSCNAQVFDSGESLLKVLTYSTPVVLGPILQVLLFGSYMGFVMSLILTAFATLMLGQGMEFFILLFISSLFTIYLCSSAQRRSRVVLSGFVYGIILAVSAIFFGVLNATDTPIMVIAQAISALIFGLLVAIIANAVLPFLEKLSKTSSNITLLELTDFNNPLLNKLQIEASGTYHHSVMVAHIAEYAASQVRGANPLVCRVGALYHDIGKIIKPEFFTENQSGIRNPHDDQTPSMSALIIKSHIKEGREIAQLGKLPKPVMDAIEEHHGTSIIMYFYNKAMNLVGATKTEDPVSVLREAGIDESTYRHEGRKPQSIETAILLLADSCEAASRSLRKVTPHAVEELVNNIVRQKMNDGQLDEAPITVQQLTTIKKAFVFTMLNMLHSRVEYNNEPKKETK